MKSILFAAAISCASAEGVESLPDPGLDITVLQSRVKVARYEMPLVEGRDQHTFTAACAYVFQ
jgi:hypothetical protein